MRSHDSLIVVTGATGWVGRNILEVLQNMIPAEEFNSNVLALASKKQIIKSSAYSHNKSIDITVENLNIFPKICKQTNKIYLIHCAFITKNYISKFNTKDYISNNLLITDLICEGISQSNNIKAVEISSGEASIFDDIVFNNINHKEINNAPYAYLKKREEVEMSKLIQPLILRIYALSGKFVRNPKIYALSNMLLQTIKRKPLIIDTTKEIQRSFGHAKNISELACCWLLSNKKPSNLPLSAVSYTTNIRSLARIISDKYDLNQPIIKLNDYKLIDSYTDSEVNFLHKLDEFNIKVTSFDKQIEETYFFLKNIK